MSRLRQALCFLKQFQLPAQFVVGILQGLLALGHCFLRNTLGGDVGEIHQHVRLSGNVHDGAAPFQQELLAIAREEIDLNAAGPWDWLPLNCNAALRASISGQNPRDTEVLRVASSMCSR